MNFNNDSHAELTQTGEIRLVRLLPGPIERVWGYLTDPEKRGRWFAGGPMELRAGGKLRLFFRHANIAPHETPPADYQKWHDPGEHMDGTVLRCEPPRLLSYTFGEKCDVTFELTAQGDQVLLVLTHRCRGDAVADAADYAGGWHTHCAILLALLEERTLPPFWSTHLRLDTDYKRRLPSPSPVPKR